MMISFELMMNDFIISKFVVFDICIIVEKRISLWGLSPI